MNQTGAENTGTGRAFPIKLVMFLAADDAAKKPVVLDLVAKLGFQAVDAGPLKIEPFLELLAMLSINQMLNCGRGPDSVFALIGHS